MKVVNQAIHFSRWCLLMGDPRVGGFCVAGVTGTPTAIDVQRQFWDMGMSLPDTLRAGRVSRGRRHAYLFDTATQTDLARWVRRKEVLRSQGIGDELWMPLTSEGRHWGSLALYRESDEPLFTRNDARAAAQLAPTLAGAARNSWITPVRSPLPPPSHAGVLLLDSTGEKVGTTLTTDQWLARHDRTTQSEQPIIDCLRARLNGQPEEDGTANTLIRDAHGSWVNISASRIVDRNESGVVAVTFEAAPPEVISDVLLHAYPFTERERQIVSLTIGEATNKEIGAYLKLSRFTVADYLKSIFAKTGAHSRNDLARVMTGRLPL
ncbi:LuxR C-terminal-related transcriptional regulator [Amycolatopsis sp. NPDC024027]|uniref:LuxR C-terminal-related transcriptional regulator n=1 Tax=Amycolatopsis sp. NPDC024027 TaxID=3154327 RepID=UPI0033DF250F